MRRHITALTIGGVALLTGALAIGLRPPVPAQEERASTLGERLSARLQRERSIQPWPPPIKDGGWRLVPSRTTSAAWLYSSKTGRVYRVLSAKDYYTKAAPHGCLVPLPAICGPHRSDDLPSTGEDY